MEITSHYAQCSIFWIFWSVARASKHTWEFNSLIIQLNFYDKISTNNFFIDKEVKKFIEIGSFWLKKFFLMKKMDSDFVCGDEVKFSFIILPKKVKKRCFNTENNVLSSHFGFELGKWYLSCQIFEKENATHLL